MAYKTFAAVARVVFGAIAIVHALRFLYGWNVVVGSYIVPVWLSAVAAVFAGYLSIQGFRLKK